MLTPVTDKESAEELSKRVNLRQIWDSRRIQNYWNGTVGADV